MTFSLEWKEGAIRQLEKLHQIISSRIVKKVNELSENPFSRDIKRLKGEIAFRLRVGDYRIILDINTNKKLITVLRLGHRKNIYD